MHRIKFSYQLPPELTTLPDPAVLTVEYEVFLGVFPKPDLSTFSPVIPTPNTTINKVIELLKTAITEGYRLTDFLITESFFQHLNDLDTKPFKLKAVSLESKAHTVTRQAFELRL